MKPAAKSTHGQRMRFGATRSSQAAILLAGIFLLLACFAGFLLISPSPGVRSLPRVWTVRPQTSTQGTKRADFERVNLQ